MIALPASRPVAPLGAALLLLAACGAPAPEPRTGRAGALPVAELLSSADTEGFARAVEPREFVFPGDHGPHPGFRTEWWYVTGNLRSPGGRRFGYQVTFFRNELTPDPPRRASAWAAAATWMAHFAVVDGRTGRFHPFERFARGALGLAGAAGPPREVWLEEWRLEHLPEADAFRVTAADGEVGLDVTATPAKPPVLQGDRGLSPKGRAPGNASYYYSLTRMATRGTLRLGGRVFEVAGASWMDREWSTSALEEGQVGWDWFALQLADGRDLMFYRLRRADGTTDPISAGSLVEADGSARELTSDEVRIFATRRWTAEDGVTYPVAWRLEVPAAGLDLAVEAIADDQEHRHTFRYWEGAVDVAGGGDEGVEGVGYVELTGYADVDVRARADQSPIW
ncbi:MAG: lipocalin-like domain-containing protein [Thermoanaerobaculia bacterium]|nr:lipocalin-like domain-containing protein [Thermoanaerobaculia bacterium]